MSPHFPFPCCYYLIGKFPFFHLKIPSQLRSLNIAGFEYYFMKSCKFITSDSQVADFQVQVCDSEAKAAGVVVAIFILFFKIEAIFRPSEDFLIGGEIFHLPKHFFFFLNIYFRLVVRNVNSKEKRVLKSLNNTFSS